MLRCSLSWLKAKIVQGSNRKQNKIKSILFFFAEVQFIIFEDGVRRAKNLLFFEHFFI